MGILSHFFRKKSQDPTETRAGSYVPDTTIKPPAPKKKAQSGTTYKVAGVSHYRGNILSMAVENEDYKLGKRALIAAGLVETRVPQYDFFPHKTELVPEPDNPHDPKAIKVLVDDLHVGYIKAGSCAHLLKVIQEDRIQKIDVTMGGGKSKYLAVVDYKENGDEIYSLETDDYPLYVHLKITEKKV